MTIDWERIYMGLGALLANPPGGHPDALARAPGQVSADMHQWVGRVFAFVEMAGDPSDIAATKTASDHLNTVLRQGNAGEIYSVAHRTLARAEARVAPARQGAFVPVGHQLDAFAAIGHVFSAATHRVLLVDPYMDEKAVTSFGTLVPQTASFHLLADERDRKASLTPAVDAWIAQYGAARPLEARLAPYRVLHDRMIICDDAQVWVLTQSLNAFAARSPATILKVDAETSALKVAAYAAIWAAASPLQ